MGWVDGLGADGLYRTERIQWEMTFSWFWCPLIGHAMGEGRQFPAFPVTSNPRFQAWVADIRNVISVTNKRFRDIINRDRHPSAAFQEHVMGLLEANGLFDTLNGANNYALETAVAAATEYNSAVLAARRGAGGSGV